MIAAGGSKHWDQDLESVWDDSGKSVVMLGPIFTLQMQLWVKY